MHQGGRCPEIKQPLSPANGLPAHEEGPCRHDEEEKIPFRSEQVGIPGAPKIGREKQDGGDEATKRLLALGEVPPAGQVNHAVIGKEQGNGRDGAKNRNGRQNRFLQHSWIFPPEETTGLSAYWAPAFFSNWTMSSCW